MATSVLSCRWPGVQQIDRRDGENIVAIDEIPVFVAEQNAIGIAVVGDADLGAAFLW